MTTNDDALVEKMVLAASGDILVSVTALKEGLRAVKPIIEREALEKAAKEADWRDAHGVARAIRALIPRDERKSP